MKSSLRNRISFFVTVACLFGGVTSIAHAQSPYFVNKTQTFTQTSASGAVADPTTPFNFSASANSSTTLTLPGGSTMPIPARVGTGGDSPFQLSQDFSTKAALDAAFPSGTYRISGSSIPTLSFNLTTDAYPSVNPAVVGGTWNAGGMFVVNPTQNTTITISTFTGYATGGVGGHMSTFVTGFGDNVDIETEALSVANPFGIPVSSTPITTISIPAGRLTNGRVYQGEVDFDTATTFDTANPPGSATVALFSKVLKFYIAAATAGDGGAAPTITTQPSSQTGTAGGSVTFALAGNFTFPATNIIWSFNGQNIFPDGTKYQFNNGALVVRNLTSADAGNYSALIINTGGVVTSNTATLTIGAAPTPTAPTVTRHPASITVTQGSTATFGVEASGTPAPTYRWQRNGQDVQATGSTGPTISIPSAAAANAGTYTCIVTNSAGTVTSNAATLTIATNFNDPGRLINLSVLTDITASGPSSSFTLGTVVGGTGTAGTKPLVIRAVGPSLGALGLPGTIADPKVDLLTGQTVALTNDNWNGDVGVLNAMASVGAFAFTGPTSKDAAIYAPSLTSRDYTVAVSGVGGAAGTVIAEIYDATPAGTFTSATPRLINVSVLKSINANGSITLGFTVGGSSAKAILIRAIGPGLAAVGLTSGTVPDPQLTLFNSNSVAIATNNDWNSDQAISVVGGRVNAFNVGTFGAKDAMLLVTLPAGGYTARASGVGGAGGTVIVEAYEVP